MNKCEVDVSQCNENAGNITYNDLNTIFNGVKRDEFFMYGTSGYQTGEIFHSAERNGNGVERVLFVAARKLSISPGILFEKAPKICNSAGKINKTVRKFLIRAKRFYGWSKEIYERAPVFFETAINFF